MLKPLILLWKAITSALDMADVWPVVIGLVSITATWWGMYVAPVPLWVFAPAGLGAFLLVAHGVNVALPKIAKWHALDLVLAHSTGWWMPLEDEAEFAPMSHAVLLKDLRITNPNERSVNLLCKLRIRLRKNRIHPRRPEELREITDDKWTKVLHADAGVIEIPSEKTATITKAFRVDELAMLLIRGPENVAQEGHELVLQDLVSGKSRIEHIDLIGMEGESD